MEQNPSELGNPSRGTHHRWPPETREAVVRTAKSGWGTGGLCHRKLVQTGARPDGFQRFVYETGYSIYVLRQATP